MGLSNQAQTETTQFLISDFDSILKRPHTGAGMAKDFIIDAFSQLAQDVVQRNLVSKGYSADSSIVEVARYWTDLTIKMAAASKEGPTGVLAAAAETSLVTVLQAAVKTGKSVTGDLSSIDTAAANLLLAERDLSVRLQDAIATHDAPRAARLAKALGDARETMLEINGYRATLLGGANWF